MADQLDLEKLAAWEALVQKIEAFQTVVEQERALRAELFKAVFTDPREGVNDYPLANGYILKGTYRVTRTIDEAALPAVMEGLRANGADPSRVFVFKPNLVVGAYKCMDPMLRAIVDEAVTSKPGLPSMEIVLPKKAANGR